MKTNNTFLVFIGVTDPIKPVSNNNVTEEQEVRPFANSSTTLLLLGRHFFMHCSAMFLDTKTSPPCFVLRIPSGNGLWKKEDGEGEVKIIYSHSPPLFPNQRTLTGHTYADRLKAKKTKFFLLVFCF